MSAKCPFCQTKFEEADYMPHMEAHQAKGDITKQQAYDLRRTEAYYRETKRHKPGDPCNCPFFGTRNYCEALRPERF